MSPSIRRKLEALAERKVEVERLLASQEVLADNQRFRNFSKEYAELEPIANQMDELVSGHAAIMDKYDPEKKVAMYVDEWGTWHLVEPGTNPGFLYQQNTMRDALAAAVTFDVFNRHAIAFQFQRRSDGRTSNKRYAAEPRPGAMKMIHTHQ